MTCDSHYLFFSNLANKTRFAIVMALRLRPSSVTEITQFIGGEQSNVSHQLKQLVKCNILFVRQEGKKRIYSVNRELVEPILELIDKHTTKFCTGCQHRIDDLRKERKLNKEKYKIITNK